MTQPPRSTDTGTPQYPGTPGWVKVSGIIVLVLVLMFVGAHVAGRGMGPGMHAPPPGGR